MRQIAVALSLGSILIGCGSNAVTAGRQSVTPRTTGVCGIERSQREPSLLTFTVDEARTCETACNQGDLGSCVTLGLAVEKGRSVPKDYEKAYNHYHKACAKGHVRACSHQAQLQVSGAGTDLDQASGVAIARRTCDQGDALGCQIMGEAFYGGGGGVEQDVTRAAVFLRRACDGGDMEGCSKLAALYSTGEGVARNMTTAQALARRACEGGDPSGCFGLGSLRLSAAAQAYDDKGIATSLKLLERACESGSFDACNVLGEVHSAGQIVRQNIPRAAEWFVEAVYRGDRNAFTALYSLGSNARDHLKSRCMQDDDAIACVVASGWFGFEPTTESIRSAAELAEQGCTKLKNQEACALLAVHYIGSGGVEKDLNKALTLATEACDFGAVRGCESVAVIRSNQPSGGPRDAAAMFPHLRRACHLYSIDGCATLGQMYTVGDGVEKNRQLGFRLLERTCAAGHGPACGVLANYYLNGWEPAQKDLARHVQLLNAACTGGDMEGCRRAGTNYMDGTAVGQNLAKGFGLVKNACDAKDDEACRIVTLVSAVGWGTERDTAHGEENLRALCKKDDLTACALLAALLTAKDAGSSEAVALRERACSGGIFGACEVQGEMYFQGIGVTRDPSKAASYMDRACALGSANACSFQGSMYLQGQGVTASDALASKLQKQACDLGSMRGCAALGELHEKGKGVERDWAKAASLYERACTGNYAPACRRFGEMLIDGKGVLEQDPARAVDILEDASRLGDTDAIAKLLDLRAKGWVAPRRLEATLDDACARDALPACRSLAFLWWDPPAKSLIERRPADAMRLAEKACNGNDLQACGIAARAYEVGAPPMPERKLDKGTRIIEAQQAIKKDIKRAIARYAKGCGEGVLGGFSAASIGLVPKVDVHTTAVPVGAFERSDPASCYGWTRLEPKRAPELLERACRAKFEPACAELRERGSK